MVKVAVPGNRAAVSQTPTGLEITVPAKRSVFIILFLAFWLVMWVVGEVSAFKQVATSGKALSENLFMVAWIGGWTVGGAFAIYTWLWTIAGKEKLRLAPPNLVLRREVFGLGRSREFDLAHVSNLRVSTSNLSFMDPGSALQFWGLTGGPIAFDYGSKTIRFGASLEESEARRLVDQVQKQHGLAS